MIDTAFKEKLKRESKEKGVHLAEFCRNKLRENFKLEKIEYLLKEILKKIK